MKVVHLSTTDFGGAYKAAERIHKSMLLCGVDSKVLVRTKTREDSDCEVFFHNPVSKLISKVKNVGNLLLSDGEVISDYLGTNVSKHPDVQTADVIILHWVNSFVSYHNVEQLLKTNKKIIWVMHDMWLATGGCHCDQYCGKYAQKCKNCPMTKKTWISEKNYARKVRMLHNQQLIIVCPSNWLASCARQSEITKKTRIYVIPNPLDIDLYNAIDKKKPTEKKIILFGAMNALSDKNKGYKFFKEAIKKIKHKENFCLKIFGNREIDSEMQNFIETEFLGYVKNEKEIVKLYSGADVMVCPSLQENYPYSILEAEACGTPVVAFDTGGIPDLIKHKQNGYLARYKDIDDLCKGILFCINKKSELGTFGKREVATRNNYREIASRYMDILK